MLKGIKVQIYPSKKQEQYLASLFGTYRFVYNKSLELKIKEYTDNKKSIGLKELGKNFTDLRSKTNWIQKHNTKVLKQSILNMLEAYKRFFVNKTGFPKFRSKHDRQSCRFPVDAISRNTFKNNKIFLTSECKNLKFKCSDKYKKLLEQNNGKIKSATISKNKAGKYFCSFLVDINHEILIKNERVIALDLGINSFLITSENTEITNPRFYRRNEKRLKLLQRCVSKKVKGSKNRNKARLKLAKFFYKISNQKSDFLHKLSTKLVSENYVIGVETLAVKNMMENSYLAKSIQELSLSEFVRQLEYKAVWNDRLLVKVGRYFASSKLCSECGWKNDYLTLADRIFKCKSCELEIGRDYNAALNIKNEALRLIGSRPPEFKPVEISELSESVKQESNIIIK